MKAQSQMCRCYLHVMIDLGEVTTKEEFKQIMGHAEKLDLKIEPPSTSTKSNDLPSSSSKSDHPPPSPSISKSSPFKCHLCPKKFRDNVDLGRHMASHFKPNINCPYCTQKFTLKTNLQRHINKLHSSKKF